VEVKPARHGMPKRGYEPMPAFSNRIGGGVILFGLDESSDLSIVGGGDAHRLQEDITHLASELMEPALRPGFTADEVEDETVAAGGTIDISMTQRRMLMRGINCG